MTLDEALDYVSVHWDWQTAREAGNTTWPTGWFAVSRDDRGGIIAYFEHEDDACRFRLAEVNRLVNP